MKRHLRHLYSLTLLAFLLNALLPFYTNYNMPTASASSQPGEKILICSVNGFKWVTLAALQSEKNHHNPAHYKCGLCVLAANGLQHLALPGEIALDATTKAKDSTAIPYRDQAALLPPKSYLYSRAPPFYS